MVLYLWFLHSWNFFFISKLLFLFLYLSKSRLALFKLLSSFKPWLSLSSPESVIFLHLFFRVNLNSWKISYPEQSRRNFWTFFAEFITFARSLSRLLLVVLLWCFQCLKISIIVYPFINLQIIAFAFFVACALKVTSLITVSYLKS